MSVDWVEHFRRERELRRALCKAGVARPRAEALARSLACRPSSPETTAHLYLLASLRAAARHEHANQEPNVEQQHRTGIPTMRKPEEEDMNRQRPRLTAAELRSYEPPNSYAKDIAVLRAANGHPPNVDVPYQPDGEAPNPYARDLAVLCAANARADSTSGEATALAVRVNPNPDTYEAPDPYAADVARMRSAR